ncbi:MULTISPECIES: ankyrin repeat domain-containing protein [unclassified Rhodococcus (in: high G+C Gram-positive bacteria)]|uniref:ankyrin repeat domain-containing protein n=1 Tax=unclassified Rhodococcus (in: high G+C Gram-positive bacteria) TaxID=192944 RepID=UPI0015C59EFD|nr:MULTISPECIES: ankyrin repeat domain-containing protein [unclassified Rhodococcus (in: high G+C Gram-positive bacteria)]
MTDRDEYGRTALHYAAANGRLEEAKQLIEQGADVDDRDSEEWTPLLFASQAAHIDVAAALLEAGANANAHNSKGQPALYFALFVRRMREPGVGVSLIQTLREHGADATLKTIECFFGSMSVLDVAKKDFIEQGSGDDLVAVFEDLL